MINYLYNCRLGKPMTLEVTPSQPVFYEFTFQNHSNLDMVIVKVTSENDICAVVSVQNVSVSKSFLLSLL